LIEVALRRRTTGGRVKRDGDPRHASFQFRAHNEVDTTTSKDTIYIRADGID
jgi:hypothetical protein